jgi:hypothetical protein
MTRPGSFLARPPGRSSTVARRRRRYLAVALLVAAAVAILLLQANCPRSGCALFGPLRVLNELKNRTAFPSESDFDRRVTLGDLLRPGDDRYRWSADRAAAIQGYVVSVHEARPECANCFALTRRDIHIDVALRPGAPPVERVVVEVTPRMRDLVEARGLDWSAAALERDLVGRVCRFEGWLMFDDNHDGEAENTAPGRPGNWRATAWELHPVTAVEVVR